MITSSGLQLRGSCEFGASGNVAHRADLALGPLDVVMFASMFHILNLHLSTLLPSHRPMYTASCLVGLSRTAFFESPVNK